jgi:hypothetical protein
MNHPSGRRANLLKADRMGMVFPEGVVFRLYVRIPFSLPIPQCYHNFISKTSEVLAPSATLRGCSAKTSEVWGYGDAASQDLRGLQDLGGLRPRLRRREPSTPLAPRSGVCVGRKANGGYEYPNAHLPSPFKRGVGGICANLREIERNKPLRYDAVSPTTNTLEAQAWSLA